MKPPPFHYLSPRSFEEALESLAEQGDDSKVLAGGQSLVPLLALRLARPSALIDLSRVPGLDYIRREGDEVAVGTMTTERTAERSAVIASDVPLLATALPYIGHVAIRNRGTVGGSSAHADPAAEIPAVAMATDATFRLASRRGTRTVPASEFFQGFFTTALQPDEMLAEVRFPAMTGAGVAFEEASRRHGDFAMVGAAAVVRMTDGVARDVRLVLTGVTDTAYRCRDAEEALTGSRCSTAEVKEAAQMATRSLTPPSDLHGSSEYRRHVARVLLERAVAKAATGAANE